MVLKACPPKHIAIERNTYEEVVTWRTEGQRHDWRQDGHYKRKVCFNCGEFWKH